MNPTRLLKGWPARHGVDTMWPVMAAGKEKACMNAGLFGFFGSPTWTRTRDLRINSPSLYRLSYQGIAERDIITTLVLPVNTGKAELLGNHN